MLIVVFLSLFALLFGISMAVALHFVLRYRWLAMRSEQLESIFAHMTADEYQKAHRAGSMLNLLISFTVGIVFGATMFFGSWLHYSYWSGVATIASILPIVLLMIVIRFMVRPYFERHTRQFLASTRWSQEQGLTPDDIALYKSS